MLWVEPTLQAERLPVGRRLPAELCQGFGRCVLQGIDAGLQLLFLIGPLQLPDAQPQQRSEVNFDFQPRI